MKEIKIEYSEYVLPKEKSVFYTIGKFGGEYFKAKCYRKDKTFTLAVENPDLFLANNKSFTVNSLFFKSFARKNSPEVLRKRDKTKNKTAEAEKPKDFIFDIKKWEYKFNGTNEREIVASAQIRNGSQFDVAYDSLPFKWQLLLPFSTFLVIYVLSFLVYAFVRDYPEPLSFWTFVGKYIQTTISWSLLFLMIGLFIWSLVIYRGSVIIQSYLSAASMLLVIILPIVWATISAKPKEFIGQPNEDILYLNYLRNYISTSLLILVGFVPWITIFLKFFGYDLLSTLLTQAVKKKSE